MGKIKKILENELVGGTQTTDVYPVTSIKAVYDESNERLDNILKNLDDEIGVLKQEIIYDVSARNNDAVFESLSALLGSADLSTLIPTSVRYGGMSIRFIQGSVPSSDNKYVQYRLMANQFSITPSDWLYENEELRTTKYNVGHKNLFRNKYTPETYFKKYLLNGNLTDTGYKLFVSEKIAVNKTIEDSLTISCAINSLGVSSGYRFLDDGDNVLTYGPLGDLNFKVVQIPDDAAYFQFSSKDSNMGYITVEYGKIPSADVRQSLMDESSIAENLNNISQEYDFRNKKSWSNFFIQSDTWHNTAQSSTFVFYSIVVPVKKGAIAKIINNDAISLISVRQLNNDNITQDLPVSLVTGDVSKIIKPYSELELEMLGSFLYVQLGYTPAGSSSSANLVQKAPSIIIDGADMMVHYGYDKLQALKLQTDYLSNFVTYYKYGNLFNSVSVDIMRNYYIHPFTGIITSTGYNLDVSPIIPVNGADYINVSLQTTDNVREDKSRGWRFLASDGETVLSFGANENKKSFYIQVPEVNGVKPTYFQITYSHKFTSFLVVTYGKETPGSYLFYGDQMAAIQEHLGENLTFLTPKEMLFAVGKSSGIYFNSILDSSVYDSPQYIDFSNLTIQNRTNRAVYQNQAAATSGTINIKVTKKNIDYIASVPKKVINGASFSGNTVNILAIGDSYTEIGQYLDQINSCAIADGISVNWIGLMNTKEHHAMSENQTGGQLYKSFMQKRLSDNTSSAFCEGTTYKVSVRGLTIKEYDINYEKYTGYKDSNNVTWWVKGYKLDSNGDGYLRLTSNSTTAVLLSSGTLTKNNSGVGDSSVAYTSVEEVNRNPLWDDSTLTYSFSYYINKWGFSSPDILLFMFSWNDLSTPWSTSGITTWVNSYFTPFVQKFHTEYPNANVIFVIPGFGRTINPLMDVDGIKWNRQYLLQELRKVYDDVSYVQICPSYMFVDSENGYNGTDVVVNSFYPDYKLSIPNQSSFVHCNEGGMYEIGNSVYPYILNTL